MNNLVNIKLFIYKCQNFILFEYFITFYLFNKLFKYSLNHIQ